VSADLLAVPFGLGIGLLLGLLGGGGSILAVPVLVYVLGQPVREATTESLLVVGAAALVGAADRARAGLVQVRVALAFGAAAAPGAVAGSVLNRLIGGRALLLAFAVLLLAVAAAMVLREEGSGTPAGRSSVARVAGVGVATGVLTGLFGVGGGFVVVPALALLLGLPLPLAVGTSLLVIALTSAAALAAHLAGGGLDWTVATVFAAAAVAGALAGRRAGARLQGRRLGELFAVLLAAVALLLLVENAGVL
jgi:uncharacterized protein